MVKKSVKYVLRELGYQFQKIDKIQKINKNQKFTMEGALQRCTERGLEVNSVIDVGASDSMWSRMCIKFLPDAKYLMIEAQDAHKEGLEKFRVENVNADYVIAAAGSREGNIFFDNGGLFGGLASETPFDKNCIEVPVVTIDSEIKRRKLQPPFLIKLDTHGFEVPILKGAREALKQAELVIIETYNYQLTTDSLKYYQMCEYMEKLGFSTIEIVDFSQRRFDNSFWQMDTFFIPSNRKEFTYNSYM
jgi:FkbM family methyltransferase